MVGHEGTHVLHVTGTFKAFFSAPEVSGKPRGEASWFEWTYLLAI